MNSPEDGANSKPPVLDIKHPDRPKNKVPEKNVPRKTWQKITSTSSTGSTNEDVVKNKKQVKTDKQRGKPSSHMVKTLGKSQNIKVNKSKESIADSPQIVSVKKKKKNDVRGGDMIKIPKETWANYRQEMQIKDKRIEELELLVKQNNEHISFVENKSEGLTKEKRQLAKDKKDLEKIKIKVSKVEEEHSEVILELNKYKDWFNQYLGQRQEEIADMRRHGVAVPHNSEPRRPPHGRYQQGEVHLPKNYLLEETLLYYRELSKTAERDKELFRQQNYKLKRQLTLSGYTQTGSGTHDH